MGGMVYVTGGVGAAAATGGVGAAPNGTGATATGMGGATSGGGGGLGGGGGTVTGAGGTLTGGAANAAGGQDTSPSGGKSGGSTSGTDQGEYHTEGSWQGYAYASASGGDSTIEPADFKARKAGEPFCVSGGVDVTSDSSAVALVGWNINQAKTGSDPEAATAVTTGEGLIVNVPNAGGSPLRVQIQGAEGATQASQRWCVELTEFDRDVLIPWGDFNNACWDGSGDAYENEPINAVAVLVPGNDTDAVEFEFCVQSIRPSDQDTNTGSGGAGGAGSGETGGSNGAEAGAGNGTGGGSSEPGGGAFYTNGSWQGYTFASASGGDSDITPEDFEDRGAGEPFCAEGTVDVTEDSSGTALVGWNVNQTKDGDPETVEPTGAGVLVNVSNAGDSPIRVQIQGPNGDDDPDERWCAPLETFDEDVTIPWGDFRTECWGNDGAVYDGEPITAVVVLVPGNETDTVDYDFCVNSVGPSEGGSATPVGGGGAEGSGA